MIQNISFEILVVTLSCTLLCSACGSSLKVEKGVAGQLNGIEKIVSVSPDFEVVTSTSMEDPRDFKFYKTVEKNFIEAIKTNGERNGLEIEVINETKNLDITSDFYNKLAPLKQEILHAAFMQEFEGGSKNSKLNGIYKFNKKPIISSEYSHLSKEYSTNYFAIQGINIHKKPRAGNFLLVLLFPPLGLYNLAHIETDLYYYNIVADVSKGEIVHKELRKVTQSINKSTINAMLYDSYKLMIK